MSPTGSHLCELHQSPNAYPFNCKKILEMTESSLTAKIPLIAKARVRKRSQIDIIEIESIYVLQTLGIALQKNQENMSIRRKILLLVFIAAFPGSKNSHAPPARKLERLQFVL